MYPNPEIPKKPIVTIKTGDQIPENVMDYLIQAGRQAPSGDNCQPWEFKLSPNQIDLFLDKEKDRSFFNVRQVASIISCGAVIENICIAASSFGIRTNLVYESDSKDDFIASINLSLDNTPIDVLSDFIWNRHTNRKFYEKRPLPDSIIDKLNSSVRMYPGTRFHILTDRKKIKQLAKIIYQIDRIRTEHRPLHDHMMNMIRFTDEEVLKTRNGLPLKNLEAGLANEIFLKAIKPWPVMNIMNKIGFGRLVALHSYQAIMNASGAGLITIQGQNDKDFLLGGQALERIWLTLTSLGIQMQPMTAITLFYQRLLCNGKIEFQKKHQMVLERLKDEYEGLFGLSDNLRSQIMLFRFGYSDHINYRTLREQVTQ